MEYRHYFESFQDLVGATSSQRRSTRGTTAPSGSSPPGSIRSSFVADSGDAKVNVIIALERAALKHGIQRTNQRGDGILRGN